MLTGQPPVPLNLARGEAVSVSRRALTPDVPRNLERVRRFGSCLLSDGEERPSRALDDRVAQRNVRGRVARDGREPAFAEAHLGELDERGLPQQEAVQAEPNVARGALLLRGALLPACRAVHFLRHVIEHALARLACGRSSCSRVSAQKFLPSRSQIVSVKDRPTTVVSARRCAADPSSWPRMMSFAFSEPCHLEAV